VLAESRTIKGSSAAGVATSGGASVEVTLNVVVETASVKDDIQLIRDTLTSHVAKKDVVYEIFKRVMNTGVTITGALIALLLSIIGYLLVNPVVLHWSLNAIARFCRRPRAAFSCAPSMGVLLRVRVKALAERRAGGTCVPTWASGGISCGC
jgi:hypothetical protein